MTREEVDELIKSIEDKLGKGERLTKYEKVVLNQVKLAKRENRENREVLVENIEEIKFWMG